MQPDACAACCPSSTTSGKAGEGRQTTKTKRAGEPQLPNTNTQDNKKAGATMCKFWMNYIQDDKMNYVQDDKGVSRR